MSTDIATKLSILTQLLQGDRRLKRVTLTIRRQNDLEHPRSGHVLINELGHPLFSFFCHEKFKIDEKLIMNVHANGINFEYLVSLAHLHEQISSGRVMTAIPSEDDPLPIRKFYRCYAKILELKSDRPEIEGTTDTPQTVTAEGPTLQAVPDLPPGTEVPAASAEAPATETPAATAVPEPELEAKAA